ncbi:MAG: HAMP domain-containing sensor histidine kinase [Gammaproteobacteria bacterium]|nr:HAMP domain-containing sensor histidine kinase [Gammaproteobacteria bacterium]MDE0413136.1 HAMP domain-containing sensor histidine kinase [Gammaproteobacteria bacterium]
MSRKWRIPPVHRSLVGQITLLSSALLLLALAYFVFLPFMEMKTDPVERTESLVLIPVLETLFSDRKIPLASIAESENVQSAAAANSSFRLYVRRGGDEFRMGEAPRWEGALNFPQLASDANVEEQFGSSIVRIDEGSSRAMVRTGLWDREEWYVEIGGIETPIAEATGLLRGAEPIEFWMRSQRLLAVGGAIFLGVLCLILVLVRSLRRLAGIAQSLDPQAPSHVLPETGMPTEILPMVRAINHMIRKIDKANEEQAFFLAAAAHELRTPLAIVRTRVENLPEGQDKEELKDDLRRMSRLVDQLLRLMSVRNQGKPSEAVDLVSIAKSVVTERAPLVIGKGVEIDLDADGQPVKVRGDEYLLRIALANLVDNALSFSDTGQRLMVQVSRDKNITVRDEGPGIPAKELDSIFQPFAKNPPNRPGHGLGLAITRSIMALHGGSVKAANQKGGGATFALQF